MREKRRACREGKLFLNHETGLHMHTIHLDTVALSEGGSLHPKLSEIKTIWNSAAVFTAMPAFQVFTSPLRYLTQGLHLESGRIACSENCYFLYG